MSAASQQPVLGVPVGSPVPANGQPIPRGVAIGIPVGSVAVPAQQSQAQQALQHPGHQVLVIQDADCAEGHPTGPSVEGILIPVPPPPAPPEQPPPRRHRRGAERSQQSGERQPSQSQQAAEQPRTSNRRQEQAQTAIVYFLDTIPDDVSLGYSSISEDEAPILPHHLRRPGQPRVSLPGTRAVPRVSVAGDRDSSRPSASGARTSQQPGGRRAAQQRGDTGAEIGDRPSRGPADRPSRAQGGARGSLRLVHGSSGEDVAVYAVQGRAAARAQQGELSPEVMEHLRSATPGTVVMVASGPLLPTVVASQHPDGRITVQEVEVYTPCMMTYGWGMFIIGFMFPLFWVFALALPLLTHDANDVRAAKASFICLLLFLAIVLAVVVRTRG